ncbi:transposase [Mesorhizobium sp. M0118]|uniref:transposase n=1 Tax=Mesorhizobium sp. M0118 TaxID=2956884 RepID=UPI00333BA445
MTISESTLKSRDEEPVRRWRSSLVRVGGVSGRLRRRPGSGGELRGGRDGCAVARRYGLSPQQLFTWRRAARRPMGQAAISESMFVPAVVTAAPPKPAAKHRP